MRSERTNPARPSTPHDTEDADRLIRRIEARLSRACEEHKDRSLLFVHTRPWAPPRRVSPRVETKMREEYRQIHQSPPRDERRESAPKPPTMISSKDILVYPHSTVCYSARLTRLEKSPVQIIDQRNPTLRIKSIEPTFSQTLQCQSQSPTFAIDEMYNSTKRSQSATISSRYIRQQTPSPPSRPSTTPNQLSRCQSTTDELQGPTPDIQSTPGKVEAIPKLLLDQMTPADTTTWIGESFSGRGLKSRRKARKASPWELPGNAITLVEEAPPTAPYIQPPAFQGRKLAKPPHQNLTILQKQKISPRTVANISDSKSAKQQTSKGPKDVLMSQRGEPQTNSNLESMEILKIKMIDTTQQKQSKQGDSLPSITQGQTQ